VTLFIKNVLVTCQ